MATLINTASVMMGNKYLARKLLKNRKGNSFVKL